MNDRKAIYLDDAIDALVKLTNFNGVRELFEYVQEHHLSEMWSGGIVDAIDAVIGVPSAQPALDEWCTDCKEYDKEKHCCPRWNRVIRDTLKDAQPERPTGKWKYERMIHILNGEERKVRICSVCDGGYFVYDLSDGVVDVAPNFCPNCGAKMEGIE